MPKVKPDLENDERNDRNRVWITCISTKGSIDFWSWIWHNKSWKNERKSLRIWRIQLYRDMRVLFLPTRCCKVRCFNFFPMIEVKSECECRTWIHLNFDLRSGRLISSIWVSPGAVASLLLRSNHVENWEQLNMKESCARSVCTCRGGSEMCSLYPKINSLSLTLFQVFISYY